MNLTKILSGAVLVSSLSLSSCINVTSPEQQGNTGQTTQSNLKYLAFRVTSGNPPRGGVFDVGIYNQSNRDRVILGSSLPNGNFVTGIKLDASKKYRAEIYTLPNHICVLWFEDLSKSTTPDLWKDNKSDTPIDGAHLGATPIPAQGCWGF